ncbi:MAG: hypothetical protein AAGI70_03860 [Pseudomonadota bacterium]
MTPPWFAPLSTFIAFNLIGVPTIGRLAWVQMLSLKAQDDVMSGAILSLGVSALILGVNIVLYRWAARRGLPRRGQMALFLVIGLTFLLPIGTGRFSPVNLLISLLG